MDISPQTYFIGVTMKSILTKKVIFISVLFMIIFMSSCATMKQVPKRNNMDDTLVVAPVVVIDGRNPAFSYKITYNVVLVNTETGAEENFLLTTDYVGYTYIKGIPAGTYYVKEYTTVGMWDNSPRPISLDSNLVVEEGAISILPGKLVIYIYNNPEEEQSSYLQPIFYNMSDQQIRRIKTLLKTHEQYSSWD